MTNRLYCSEQEEASTPSCPSTHDLMGGRMSSKKYTRPHVPCSVDGCNKSRTARGLCPMHAWRMKHHGTIEPQKRAHGRTLEERFWTFVTRRSPIECWPWIGSLNRQGYGHIAEWRDGIRHNKRSNRLSWEIHHGPIPPGMFVCHHCDNPPCVNPDHLFLGNNFSNMRDMMRKGRKVQTHGEMHGSAKLLDDDIPIIRRMHRSGRTTQCDIAKIYNVSASTIHDIIKGKTWRHI